MMIFKKLVVVLTLMLTFNICILTVNASVTKELDIDKTYRNMDFNGNGEKDTFKIWGYDRQSGNVNFTLNGKTTQIFVARGMSCTYFKYNNANEFLIVYMHQFGGGTISVYRYNNGTLKQVNESLGLLSRNTLKNIKGRYLYVTSSPYHQNNIRIMKDVKLPNYNITSFIIKYKLDTKKHKFIPISRYADAAEKYYLTYSGDTLKTSNSPKNINKKGIILKYGQKVRLKRVYFLPYKSNGYTLYKERYEFSIGKKSGWIEEDNVKASFQ